ncbi:MAG: hypothetical protein M1837_002658 [Sclerophora amabilis]|nr:MAG: hypothetical protein M1837_002658 [Sclerophora amabilis]
MSLILAPLTEDDIPVICRLQELAFSSNAIHQAMHPPGTDYVSIMLERHSSSFRNNPAARYIKMVDPATNEIASFAKWVKRDGENDRKGGGVPGPAEQKVWPAGANAALLEEFYGSMDSKSAELMGNTPHYLLSTLATHPKYQGRGAASTLLDWGTKQADADGIPAYLEASPDGLRLYRSRGFEERGVLDMALEKYGGKGQYRMVLMLRPVREPKSQSS